MRILLYYSNKELYQNALISLSVDQNDVSLRWADNFKEAHMDRCDEVYIMYDIEDSQKERISKHYSETMGVNVFLVPEQNSSEQISQGSDSDDIQFETLEEVEAYIDELESELGKTNKLKADMLKIKQERELQEKREEEVRLAQQKVEQEQREAEEAKAKADKEKQEAEEAERKLKEAQVLAEQGGAEDNEASLEYPTREQMIKELRALKDTDFVEVEIPRNATVAQLKPLYDRHIRSETSGNGSE